MQLSQVTATHWYLVDDVSSACTFFNLDICIEIISDSQTITSPNAKDAGDNIFIYTSEVIQSHPKVLLTREGLFLWAILNGGDYDTVHFVLILGLLVYYSTTGWSCGLWPNNYIQAGSK